MAASRERIRKRLNLVECGVLLRPDFALACDAFEWILGGDHFRIEPTCDLPRQARNVRAVIGRAVAPSLWPIQQLVIGGICESWRDAGDRKITERATAFHLQPFDA